MRAAAKVSSLSISYNLLFMPKETVCKLYDYLAAVSTMPSVSKTLQQNSLQSAAGFGQISLKSQRSKISPPLADKHSIALEHSRVSKDVTRDNFLNMVGNLPNITRKSLAKPGPPMSNPGRRTKRKASIPTEAKPDRT